MSKTAAVQAKEPDNYPTTNTRQHEFYYTGCYDSKTFLSKCSDKKRHQKTVAAKYQSHTIYSEAAQEQLSTQKHPKEVTKTRFDPTWLSPLSAAEPLQLAAFLPKTWKLLPQRRKSVKSRKICLNPNSLKVLFILFLYSFQHILTIYDVKSPISTFGLAEAALSSEDGGGRSAPQCKIRCNEQQFQCEKSCKCIDKSQVCDGDYLDCGYKDISDEYTAECVQSRAEQISYIHSQGCKKCIDSEKIKCIHF